MKSIHTVAALMALTALQACGGGGGNSQTTEAPLASAPAPAPAPAPVPAPAPRALRLRLPCRACPGTCAGASLSEKGIFNVNFGNSVTGTYTFLDDGRMVGLDFYLGSLAGEPWATLPASNSLQSLNTVSWADFIDDASQVGTQTSSGSFGRNFSGNGVSITIAQGRPANSRRRPRPRPPGRRATSRIRFTAIPWL